MLTEHKMGPGGKDKGLLQSIINFAATEAITNFNKVKDAPDSITPTAYDQLRYHERAARYATNENGGKDIIIFVQDSKHPPARWVAAATEFLEDKGSPTKIFFVDAVKPNSSLETAHLTAPRRYIVRTGASDDFMALRTLRDRSATTWGQMHLRFSSWN
jgi:hypothetical protein